MESFRFVGYPVRVHAGPGAIGRLAEEVDRARAIRTLIVCGQSVANRTDLVGRVSEALGDRLAGVFSGVATSSPLTAVLSGVEAAASVGADSVVALGGGSAVVTARAITILLAEGGTAQEHATKYPPGQPPVSPRLMQPKIPNFVVLTTPTTAVTRAGTAVIDPETGHRLELFDPKTRPAAVFWDDQALLTASPSLCLNAAASCYTGVAGALQGAALNPLAESDLLQAWRLLSENLPLVHSRPEDAGVRANLCAAAFIYNRATDAGAGGSALGVVSALAHSLDTRYPECGHGDAYSIFTAPGMRFNMEQNTAAQARFADAAGVRKEGMDDRAAAGAAADLLERTFRDLGMPQRLGEVGVPNDGIQQIAEDAMTDFGLRRNPRKVNDVSELVGIISALW